MFQKDKMTEENSPLDSTYVQLIKDYFSPAIDSKKYRSRDNFFINGGAVEIENLSQTQGYVFVPEIQLERDTLEAMNQIRKVYQARGFTLEKAFTDFKEGISGFSWSKK